MSRDWTGQPAARLWATATYEWATIKAAGRYEARMTTPRIVLRTQIDDDFEGFDDDMLFKLTNDTYWVQDEYKYWYHYAYRPMIELIDVGGRLYLRVVGQEQAVAVKQVASVIESRINGEFRGWDGETMYQLVNGEVWQQAAYKYEYKYAYMPEVLIYDAGSGPMMQVAGTSAKVRRIQ